MNLLGQNTQQQLIGMGLVPNPTDMGAMPVSALTSAYFSYLEANEVDINKNIKKYLDTSHSLKSDLVVAAKQRVSFFTEIGNPAENEHFLIFGIRVSEAVNAVITKSVWVPGVVDPDVINGTFSVTSNGLKVMTNHPTSDFTRATNEPYSGVIVLPKPIIWEAQTQLSLDMDFPVNVAAANTNLRVQLLGWKLIG